MARDNHVREVTDQHLARRVAVEQADRRLPSIAASITRDNHMVWFGSAGEVHGAAPSDETQYRCGSISKTFIAVEVMRLRDEGCLDLADAISHHLPELDAVKATIAQLLSHTSGLRSETSGPWWERTPGVPFEELVRSSIREADVLSPPGRRFHYSNVGYAVLGELIARVRKEPWEDVVDNELLRPAGMLRTSTRPIEPYARGFGVHPHADVVLAEPEHDAVSMGPAGQLWSTADDLSRWASVLSGHHPEVVSAATLTEMRQPIALEDTPGDAWTVAQGLGLQLFNVDGRRSFGHGGSMPGFGAALEIEESSGDAVVVLTNSTSGLSPTIQRDLLAVLHEHEPGRPDRWRAAPGGVETATLELLGAWYWGTRGFILSLDDGGLLQLDSLQFGREAAFRREGESSWSGLSGYYEGEVLRVVRRSDGSVSHLDIGSFVLTRSPYDPAAGIPGGVNPSGWTGGPPASARPDRPHWPPHRRRS